MNEQMIRVNEHRTMGVWKDGCVVNSHCIMHLHNLTIHLHNPQTIYQLLAVARQRVLRSLLQTNTYPTTPVASYSPYPTVM